MCATLAMVGRESAAQLRDTTPSFAYFAAIDELYSGDYRDAYRVFKREWNGAIKTVTARWIDSIAYHAMLGETLYHQGDRAHALQQFDFAANMYLQYPDWMLQIRFDQPLRADASLARRVPPWGVSQRQATFGDFSRSMKISQGTIDHRETIQRGGVLVQAQFWQINAVEILRATAITIRRRNELLGPLGPYDPISKDMLARLSKGGAPPNHWSNAWVDILRGMAHAGVGENEQALARLQRGLLVAGQFDHPLTCHALLEQGRLAMGAGDAESADRLFAEASYSAFAFEDLHVLDEAVRLAAMNRLANGAKVDPGLGAAAEWARRKRYHHLSSRIMTALADQLIAAGDLSAATTALSAARAQMPREMQTGAIANYALYLGARLEYAANRDSAPATLAQALDGQANMAPRNLQIALANAMFDDRTLSSRAAVDVYGQLLSDPTPEDSAFIPLETLAVMKTPNGAAYDRWLGALLERKDYLTAVEVTDRAKRRRFHGALGLGGRLAAVRRLLTAPQAQLSPQLLQQRNDVLLKYPTFAAAAASANGARDQLQKIWFPPLDDATRKQSGRLFAEYDDAIDAREKLLRRIALDRVPADYAFPPLVPTAELQARLQPGHAVMVFHDTPGGLLGFLFTNKDATHWNCGPSGRLTGPLTEFLHDLGNYDANRELTVETLASDDWKRSGAKLFDALTKGSLFDPLSTKHLVIVPDGLLWYVPFEALTIGSGGGRPDPANDALISLTPVRYAPTAGLAFSHDQPWRRIQRTGIHVGHGLMVPDDDPQRTEMVEPLRNAVAGPITPDHDGLNSTAAASLLDCLIVLDDIETEGADPLAWSPWPMDRRREAGSLNQWLTLTDVGPQRILLPGMHTPAERGGKTSRRRGTTTSPGEELFLASCTLTSAGAETLLLSRWRVGGKSTLDLMREFVQELPYADSASAWQRSVQLARETPVDPLSEMRVKASPSDPPLTASHPFFWAGYLVVDTGGDPPEAPTEPPDAAAEQKGPVEQ